MFCKAHIYLHGESSKILKFNEVQQNIAKAMRCIGLDFEFIQPHTKGFKVLKEEVNQPDILYIFNDSTPYHLSDAPCILLSRFQPWVWANPKPNCLGRIVHDVMAVDYSELLGIIARNKPMRQISDHGPANNYLLFSEYVPGKLDELGRYGYAANTWRKLAIKDIHLGVFPYENRPLLYQKPMPPFVNRMLASANEKMVYDDDIVILLNRDICLVPEATGIIRSFMESRNITACAARRIDGVFMMELNFEDLAEKKPYMGLDIFCFRKDAPEIKELAGVDLLLGSEGWDAAWNSVVKHILPFNVCYHVPHENIWQSESGAERNTFNRLAISKHFQLTSIVWPDGGVGYAPQI